MISFGGTIPSLKVEISWEVESLCWAWFILPLANHLRRICAEKYCIDAHKQEAWNRHYELTSCMAWVNRWWSSTAWSPESVGVGAGEPSLDRLSGVKIPLMYCTVCEGLAGADLLQWVIEQSLTFNSNKFLHSAFHNNRLNGLYISALVIGPITNL